MYLFIAGAPRSGTSALTELLCAHGKIALGMERYKKLYKPNMVTHALFEEEKFFDYDPLETNVLLEGAKYDQYYKELKQKYAHSTIRGDKYPFLYKNYHTLDETFQGEVKFFYILRDPYRVASSWNVRAKKPRDKWPRENDYSVAIKHWNDANERTLKAIEKGYDITVITYERLYGDGVDRDYLIQMLKGIGLSMDSFIEQKYRRQIEEYDRKIKDKALDLTKEEKSFIEDRINHTILNALLNQKHA
jgi:hypothetical protein